MLNLYTNLQHKIFNEIYTTYKNCFRYSKSLPLIFIICLSFAFFSWLSDLCCKDVDRLSSPSEFCLFWCYSTQKYKLTRINQKNVAHSS